MAALEDLSDFIRKAEGDFPLTPSTLYWRVFLVVEKQLKSKTTVNAKYHGNIAKFFAILWRYFFENKSIDVEDKSFNFPFDGHVISLSQLASLNSAIDSEMRHFMNKQETTDPHVKFANIMRMGDIGLKIKKIIANNQAQRMDPEDPFNDNFGAAQDSKAQA